LGESLVKLSGRAPKKSRVLLLDTSFSSKPIYDYLVNTGSEVYVVGANPADFLAKTAENYIHLDYSQIDEVASLIDSMKIEYIVPGCNDKSYEVCSKLNSNEKFPGIDSFETQQLINNKKMFRRIATKYGLKVPICFTKTKDIQNNLPVIVKPVDAFSGRGITIIQSENISALDTAIEYARNRSTSGEVIVEKYISGQLYSHSAFLIEQKIVRDFIVIEHGSANQFAVDTSYVVDDFPDSILNEIRMEIEVLAEKLELVDGLIHTQFILSEDAFWLIEVTRRCPGDLYSQLIEFSTGFPYAENYSKSFISDSILYVDEIDEKRSIIRHTLNLKEFSFYYSIDISEPVKIHKFIPLISAGEIVGLGNKRVGILFLEVNSKVDLSIIATKINNNTLLSLKV
jgi:carbamoylphosphate synthase large subunit